MQGISGGIFICIQRAAVVFVLRVHGLAQACRGIETEYEVLGLKNKLSNIGRDSDQDAWDGAEIDFREKISKVDILVNANKHHALKTVPLDKDQALVIVKDLENPGSGVLHTLIHRLGFEGISAVEKGVAWVLTIEGNRKIVAKKAAEQLLMNEHFQDAVYRF